MRTRRSALWLNGIKCIAVAPRRSLDVLFSEICIKPTCFSHSCMFSLDMITKKKLRTKLLKLNVNAIFHTGLCDIVILRIFSSFYLTGGLTHTHSLHSRWDGWVISHRFKNISSIFVCRWKNMQINPRGLSCRVPSVFYDFDSQFPVLCLWFSIK